MLLNMLVYDGRLEEVKNAALGSGRSMAGVVKYRVARKVTTLNYLTEMPCGVCPVVAQCREGGVISPSSCVYMNDWLALDYQALDSRSEQGPLSW